MQSIKRLEELVSGKRSEQELAEVVLAAFKELNERISTLEQDAKPKVRLT